MFLIIFKVYFLPGFEITFYKVITIKKFILFFSCLYKRSNSQKKLYHFTATFYVKSLGIRKKIIIYENMSILYIAVPSGTRIFLMSGLPKELGGRGLLNNLGTV